MIAIETENYKRISKAEARRRYNSGLDIYLLPAKMNPENMWGMMVCASNSWWGCEEYSFDTFLITYNHFNCQYAELGTYPAFYIKKGE